MNYWSKSNLSEIKGKISDGFKSSIFIQVSSRLYVYFAIFSFPFATEEREGSSLFRRKEVTIHMACGHIVRREKLNLLALFPPILLIIWRVMSIYLHEN